RGLSSAHALKGGFRIQLLVEPMKAMKTAENLNKDFETLFKSLIAMRPELTELKGFLRLEIEILVFLRKFQAVPDLNSSQVKELQTSISILHDLKNPSQGDYLYMAVLQALILKAHVLQPLKFENCQQAVRQVQTRLQSVANDYGKVITYMNFAQPSRQKDYEKQQAQIEQVLGETSLLTTSSLMTLSLVEHVSSATQPRIFISPPECSP
ncbi:MAG: hypothetical protein ACAH59_01140, partial [Pseudobdellovibrionaceae bacterium]